MNNVSATILVDPQNSYLSVTTNGLRQVQELTATSFISGEPLAAPCA